MEHTNNNYKDPRGFGRFALYIYAVGSSFESKLNEYMIDETPISPSLWSQNGSNSDTNNPTLTYADMDVSRK